MITKVLLISRTGKIITMEFARFSEAVSYALSHRLYFRELWFGDRLIYNAVACFGSYDDEYFLYKI